MSDSVRPHRQQPTRLLRPWASPVKNTGVGCHFLLQCMKVKSEREVAQSCLIPSDPMDCSLPGASIHGIFQARVLEWGATASDTKATSYYIRDLSILRFWVCKRPGTNPLWVRRNDCTWDFPACRFYTCGQVQLPPGLLAASSCLSLSQSSAYFWFSIFKK